MKLPGKRILAAVLAAAFTFALSACGRDVEQQEKQATTAPAKADQTPGKAEMPPAKPHAPVKKGRSMLPPPEDLPVSGKILEIKDIGSFIFVSMDWQGKKIWATVPGVDLKVGEEISLEHASRIRNFHVKSLNRTFDELIMASSVKGKAPRPRTENSQNALPGDPRKRRSGMMLGGSGMNVAPAPIPAKPVPARPAGAPAAKTEH
jgi:hypothetical protein